mmetsp:Transcript_19862/g.46516  ORF Transcript_19862/g.46516 Transcript_19862/m.46516 type:complete len:239 (-) Transcript_19862:1430-2146(-)
MDTTTRHPARLFANRSLPDRKRETKGTQRLACRSIIPRDSCRVTRTVTANQLRRPIPATFPTTMAARPSSFSGRPCIESRAIATFSVPSWAVVRATPTTTWESSARRWPFRPRTIHHLPPISSTEGFPAPVPWDGSPSTSRSIGKRLPAVPAMLTSTPSGRCRSATSATGPPRRASAKRSSETRSGPSNTRSRVLTLPAPRDPSSPTGFFASTSPVPGFSTTWIWSWTKSGRPFTTRS